MGGGHETSLAKCFHTFAHLLVYLRAERERTKETGRWSATFLWNFDTPTEKERKRRKVLPVIYFSSSRRTAEWGRLSASDSQWLVLSGSEVFHMLDFYSFSNKGVGVAKGKKKKKERGGKSLVRFVALFQGVRRSQSLTYFGWACFARLQEVPSFLWFWYFAVGFVL